MCLCVGHICVFVCVMDMNVCLCVFWTCICVSVHLGHVCVFVFGGVNRT